MLSVSITIIHYMLVQATTRYLVQYACTHKCLQVYVHTLFKQINKPRCTKLLNPCNSIDLFKHEPLGLCAAKLIMLTLWAKLQLSSSFPIPPLSPRFSLSLWLPFSPLRVSLFVFYRSCLRLAAIAMQASCISAMSPYPFLWHSYMHAYTSKNVASVTGPVERE